ncbi:hypothetical protein ELI06_25505 (plasmid) [Rhizobium leguminosarum]|nr:hypothetical protein ELI06_25505 [Rhizobium leguminosarum]
MSSGFYALCSPFRSHLMENASHAFLDAVRKSMRQVAARLGQSTANFGSPRGLFCATLRTLRGHRHAADSSAATTRPP